MKCPECGAEVADQGIREELRVSRLILTAATVLIAVMMITAAIYAITALKPKPELAGIFETHIVSGDDDSDGYLTMACYVSIYNTGTVGCFSNITVTVSDSRGWTETIIDSEGIGWLPPGGTVDVVEIFWVPVSHNGQEADLESIQATLTIAYDDPFV